MLINLVGGSMGFCWTIWGKTNIDISFAWTVSQQNVNNIPTILWQHVVAKCFAIGQNLVKQTSLRFVNMIYRPSRPNFNEFLMHSRRTVRRFSVYNVWQNGLPQGLPQGLSHVCFCFLFTIIATSLPHLPVYPCVPPY